MPSYFLNVRDHRRSRARDLTHQLTATYWWNSPFHRELATPPFWTTPRHLFEKKASFLKEICAKSLLSTQIDFPPILFTRGVFFFKDGYLFKKIGFTAPEGIKRKVSLIFPCKNQPFLESWLRAIDSEPCISVELSKNRRWLFPTTNGLFGCYLILKAKIWISYIAGNGALLKKNIVFRFFKSLKPISARKTFLTSDLPLNRTEMVGVLFGS